MSRSCSPARSFVFRIGDVESIIDVPDAVARLQAASERRPGERGQLEAARGILVEAGFERIGRQDAERLLEQVAAALVG